MMLAGSCVFERILLMLPTLFVMNVANCVKVLLSLEVKGVFCNGVMILVVNPLRSAGSMLTVNVGMSESMPKYV